MLNIQNITIRIVHKTLLENASCFIPNKAKVGIVGANGSGKSTLFKALTGAIDIETGQIETPKNCVYSIVQQEFSEQDLKTPILQFILDKDIKRKTLLEKLNTAPLEQQADIYEELMAIDAYSAESKACQLLKGLNFDDADFSKPLSCFSGGWKMRVALAGALFQPCDILLLDEPSNHLDLETNIWLLNYLKTYPKTLLIISHDKEFLNSVCTSIIHFENKKLIAYGGNYNTFLKTKALKEELMEKQIKKQQLYAKHLQSFIDRFRYKATKAKQAQSRIKMLEKLEFIEPLNKESYTTFSFPDCIALPPPIIKLENCATGYENKPVLKNLNFSLLPDDRIGILGKNGNGKSTFVKLLSQKLKVWAGDFYISPKLQIGYFAQNQMEELQGDIDSVSFFAPYFETPTKARSYLATFGINQEKALTLIQNLSGGEKTRLLFAYLSLNAPSLLILDEPTNHLDIDGKEALIEALNAYKGALILITHDEYLLNMVVDSLYIIENQTIKPFKEDFAAYKKYILDSLKEPIKKEMSKKAPLKENNTKEIKKIEKELKELEEKKQLLQNKLDTETDNNQVMEIYAKIENLNTKIADLESLWLNLNV